MTLAERRELCRAILRRSPHMSVERLDRLPDSEIIEIAVAMIDTGRVLLEHMRGEAHDDDLHAAD